MNNLNEQINRAKELMGILNEQEWGKMGYAWFGDANYARDGVTLTLDLIYSKTKSMTASEKLKTISVIGGKDDIEKGYDDLKKKAVDYVEDQYGGHKSPDKNVYAPSLIKRIPSLEDFTVYRAGEKEK